MSKLIEDLNEPAERRARSVLLAAHAAGLSLLVTSTLRTEDEQVALFSQGRAQLVVVNLLRRRAGLKPIGDGENAHTVTQCDGVNAKSKHQGGRAVDVVILDKFGNPIWIMGKAIAEYKQLGVIAKANGFNWGGDFTPLDAVTGIGIDPFHLEVS